MFVFAWETPDGERKWEAVKKGQTQGFLEKLVINEKIHPATIMCAWNPILWHWVFREYHENLSDVHFANINKEIYGTAPAERKHKPVDIPVTPPKPVTKYGWLAPDGRFFRCDYGGHSNLADKICGDIEYVANPERRLEEKGWAKVLAGGSFEKTYAIGMDYDKKLTDAQLKALERMGTDDIYIGSWFL